MVLVLGCLTPWAGKLSLRFNRGDFLWGAAAAGAICPSCMGQAHVQCQWQVKRKGCPMLLGQVTIGNHTIAIALSALQVLSCSHCIRPQGERVCLYRFKPFNQVSIK
eukprot:1157837-Pelagomonas_calceolata.AAC.8